MNATSNSASGGPSLPARPLPGQTLKHYRLEGLLGEGGMGVVYRAWDTRLRRPVAVKFLPAEVTADPERKQRLLQEAQAAARINHPAIAQIFNVDEVETLATIQDCGHRVQSSAGARPLHLDHVGSEVTKDHSDRRSRHVVA